MKRYYPAICSYCKGKGLITEVSLGTTAASNTIPCPVCNGSGRITITEETSDTLPDLQRHNAEKGNVSYVFETTPKNN